MFGIAGGDDVELDYRETISTKKWIRDTVTRIVVSRCGSYLVCAGSCCSIAVFKASKRSGSFSHHLSLPKYQLAPTALAIHPNSPLLVAAFSDSKVRVCAPILNKIFDFIHTNVLQIFEYHLEEMRFTCSTNKSFVANTATHAVNNIVLDPRNDNIIILHNDTYLYVLEKTKPYKGGDGAAKMARPNDDAELSSGDEVADFKLRFKKHYEHFVHLSWLDAGEMVAVGVNPVTLIEQLLPAMRQKKFGAT